MITNIMAVILIMITTNYSRVYDTLPYNNLIYCQDNMPVFGGLTPGLWQSPGFTQQLETSPTDYTETETVTSSKVSRVRWMGENRDTVLESKVISKRERKVKEVVVKSMSTGEWETVEIDGHLLLTATVTNVCTIASMIDFSKYAVSENWSTHLARFDEVDGLTVMTNRVWYRGKRYTIGED